MMGITVHKASGKYQVRIRLPDGNWRYCGLRCNREEAEQLMSDSIKEYGRFVNKKNGPRHNRPPVSDIKKVSSLLSRAW